MKTISFARGVPSADLLPVEAVRHAADVALRDDATRVLSYGTGGGYAPLRDWIADRHGVDPAQVIVTNGSLQAFVFVLSELFADGGSRCIIERPTYDRPIVILKDLGIESASVDLDSDGLQVDLLSAELSNDTARLLYTIPNYHNPAGSLLTAQRRAALVELARTHELLIYEDDPYGDLWFDAPPPATLLSAAPQLVVYASSFSKTISPGLRVGYLVAPLHLATRLQARATNTYISPGLLSQAIAHQLAITGALEQNIERARGELAQRCDALCTALAERLPGARFVTPQGGYFAWIAFDPDVDTAQLLGQAEQAGVTFVPGAAFGDRLSHCARLAFSFHPPDEIRDGVNRLAAALAAHRSASTARA